MSLGVIRKGRYEKIVRTFEKGEFSLGICKTQITP